MDNTTSKNSSNDVESITASNYAFLAFVVALYLACIVCNGLIIAAFAFERSIRNQANMFVASLASADLVIGAVSMTLMIADNAPNVDLAKFSPVVDQVCFTASMFSCVFLSLERALKINCPYWYVNTVTTPRVKRLILINWLLACLVGGLKYLDLRLEKDYNYSFAAFNFFVIYAFPVPVITFSYLSIFFVARKHSQNIRRQQCRVRGETSRRGASDAKIAWSLGIFIGVFIICWTPRYMWTLGHIFGEYKPVSSQPFKIVANILPFVNAAINPFLYAVGNPTFRKGMKKLYNKKRVSRHNRNSSRRMETSTLNTNINNSPSLSRSMVQCSPNFDRRDIGLLTILLRRQSDQESKKSLTQPLPSPFVHTAMEFNSRRSLMWETSL